MTHFALILRILRVSLRALARNKMRTFLTCLGIIIGVGAVIAMVSLGEGAKKGVEERFNSLGTNLLNVFPGSRNWRGIRTGGGGSAVAAPIARDALLPDHRHDVAHHCPDHVVRHGGPKLGAIGSRHLLRRRVVVGQLVAHHGRLAREGKAREGSRTG